jgi:SAM-dependent methyltransferase
VHPSAYRFACSALTAGDVAGKTVLEAGSMDVNGSVRPHVEGLGPHSYIATDMRPGAGVDMVLAAEELPSRFSQMGGGGGFGVVISTEMLEHAKDWQAAVRGMIGVLAEGGVLVLTTRSEGFPLHGYPEDHWRYSVDAMGTILLAAGLTVERLMPDPDPASPGVFARARKPAGWSWPEGAQAAWDAAGVTAVTA